MQLRPHLRHRLVVAPAPVVLVGQHLTEAHVGVVWESGQTALRPLEGILVPACLLVDPGDLDIAVGVGEIMGLHGNERIDIARQPSQGLHDVADMEPRRGVRTDVAWADRRHRCPALFGKATIRGEPLVSEDVRVRR